MLGAEKMSCVWCETCVVTFSVITTSKALGGKTFSHSGLKRRTPFCSVTAGLLPILGSAFQHETGKTDLVLVFLRLFATTTAMLKQMPVFF